MRHAGTLLAECQLIEQTDMNKVHTIEDLLLGIEISMHAYILADIS